MPRLIPQPADDPIDPLLAQLNSEARRAIRTRSAESVHELRVAMRRLFQGLELHRGAKKSRKPIRHLMKLSGDVRDCDIALNLLRRSWAKGAARLRQRISARRESARRVLAAELKKWIAVAASWRSDIGAPKAGPALVLPKMANDFLRRGSQMDVKHPDLAELHGFRIQAKELRYSIELMQPSVGEGASPWIRPIQEVQKVLGQVNDCRIVLELDKLLGGGNGIESALHKRLRKKVRQFRRIWHEQFAGRAAKEWVRALEPPPRKPMAQSQSAAADAPAAKRA